MRDPHVHVQKDWTLTGFGAMRDLFGTVGISFSAPKTVTTGCKVRRPLASTSVVPESVTCLACREYARDYLRGLISIDECALSLPAEYVTPEQRKSITMDLDFKGSMLAKFLQ